MHTPTTTTREFIARLEPHAGKPLIFEYSGRRIRAGYHVTEIKASSFRSLDCGARPQQWNETIVQLWDVSDQPEHGHMSVGKFLGIYRKVNSDVGLDDSAEIKFECGDAEHPAVHYTLRALDIHGPEVVASLEPVRATCKPRNDWWLAGQKSAPCCTPLQNTIAIAGIGAMAPTSCCN